MQYPGNASLSDEIKTRILNTFRQTMALAEEGRVQEAKLGCDFILKMDAQFAPAQTLKDRLLQAQGAVSAQGLLEPSGPIAGNLTAPSPKAASIAGGGLDARGAEASQHAEAGSAASETEIGHDDPTPPHGTPRPPELLDEAGNLVWSLPALKSPPAGSAGVGGVDELASGGLGASAMLDLGPLEGALDIGRSPEDAHEVETGPAPPSSKSAPGLAPSSSDPDDPESRIRRLLDEGQAAFDGGELQRAIDAWSRIFLVDVDHAEASERIERARQLKAERERRLDEMLHDALRARGAGRLDEAKETFEQILALEPTHLAARDYLDQLERGEIAPPEPAPATEEEATAGGRVERTRGRAGNFPRVAGVAKARRVVYWAAAGVAVLVLGLGWFLYSNRGRLFPNAGEAASESPSATPLSPLGQAQELHDAGKTAEALAILRQIPPASPDKARARELLAEWQRAPGDSEAATGADIAAGSEDAVLLASAERAAFLERARRSYGSREYFEAARAFRAAERLAPLAGPDADLYVDAREQLLPIAPQIDLFQQREWEMVLGPLWRRLEDDTSNRDVRRILADAYYNLGVRELRRGDPGAARDYLRELLDLAGEDVMALRLLRFAEGYTQQPRDLLYEIFVGELEYRT